MNKELVNLQRNSKATCVIINTSEYDQLTPSVIFDADVNDLFFASRKPVFAEKLEVKSKLADLCYLVVVGIDTVKVDTQNKFIGLVKDRELNGYKLPSNTIVVFTVKDRTTLTKVSAELYQFAVVAF